MDSKEVKRLIQLAKKRYPVGTKFISVYGDGKNNSIVSVEKSKFFINSQAPLQYGKCVQYIEGGWVYSSKKGWADIVKEKEYVKIY